MHNRQADAARSVLITGAAGGIGRALCAAFHDAGYRVIAADRAFESERANVADAHGIEVGVDLERCCSDEDELARFVGSVREVLAPGGLHALVNNAAVQILGATQNVTVADWEATLRVNLVAPFLLTQAFLPDLERAHGSVVNMGSIHASLTKPGFVTYATSKSGLVGMTRAMAVDLRHRVRVNTILPAAVATPMLLASFENRPDAYQDLADMHPMGRIAEPTEVAAVALFLASDAASFVTGAAWQIDGGIGGRLHDPL